MNEYTVSDITVGMRVSFTKKITAEMEHSFRMISGDNNPLHCNDDFAREISGGRYKSHVTYGMLTASLYSTVAGMYLPGKYSLIHSFEELSFMKPVFVEDELTVEAEVIDKDENLKLIRLKIMIKNQDDKTVSKARMKVLVMK